MEQGEGKRQNDIFQNVVILCASLSPCKWGPELIKCGTACAVFDPEAEPLAQTEGSEAEVSPTAVKEPVRATLVAIPCGTAPPPAVQGMQIGGTPLMGIRIEILREAHLIVG